jgi:quinoprotein glucose dehydrogenase
MKRTLVLAIGVATSLVATLVAQNNWTSVGQDAGATKYSTLDQINTGNVKTLVPAWTFHTGDKSGFFESTPLVINGTLYVSAQNGVFALDPQSGAQQWKFETDGATRRGLAYWPGEGSASGRLLISSDTKLLALDAKTGRMVPEFGQGGFVDMGVTMESPPSVYKNVLITPGGTPVIRAWNARTGALLWTFNLIAQPDDPNHKTWENDAWKTIGGTNTWGYLSVDEERGIVYIPVSIAGGDYVGAERPGDNLYGTSLVAVDIATGKRRWHQQLVHHDMWDFDLGAAPTLFDAVKDGKRIPAVAEITKMGMLFMFDRVTGAPLFGMEERPVPQSTVPGEKSSPTQPFTIKPPPLARNSLKKSELPTTISPEHTAYCAALWEKYNLQDTVPYTPWRLTQDIIMFPGAVGGGNWNGVSYNKKLGLIITNVMNAGQWGHLEEVKPGDGRGGRGGPGGGAGRGPGGPPAGAAAAGPPAGGPPPGAGRGGRGPAIDDGISVRSPYRKVTPEGGRFWDPVHRYPCNEPPWGELIAVSANTGDIVWRVPLGEFEELEKKGIKTGTASLGGGITTAGDLVFIAATIDGYFRAFDARNGKELWKTKLDAPAHAIPATYMGRDGKQYVVITAGGGGFLRSPTSDAVVAFRLP